jgi:hypothetical protein
MRIKTAAQQLSWPEKLAKLKGFERRRLWEIAIEIIDACSEDDKCYGGQIWMECTTEEKSYLWVAELKGGFFSQAEKAWIRESHQLCMDFANNNENYPMETPENWGGESITECSYRT